MENVDTDNMFVINANIAALRYTVFSEEGPFNISITDAQGIAITTTRQTPNNLLVDNLRNLEIYNIRNLRELIISEIFFFYNEP